MKCLRRSDLSLHHRSTIKVQGVHNESQGQVLYLNKLFLDNQKPTVPPDQGGLACLGFMTLCVTRVTKKVIVNVNIAMIVSGLRDSKIRVLVQSQTLSCSISTLLSYHVFKLLIFKKLLIKVSRGSDTHSLVV